MDRPDVVDRVFERKIHSLISFVMDQQPFGAISADKGGLDVGSLWAFNQALLLKWRWRFLNGNDMLWVKLIKSCHGIEGRFLNGGTTPPKSGVWTGIVKASTELHRRDLIPNSAFRRKGTLEATFPRLAALASNRNAFISDYWSTQGWNISWRRDIRGGAEQTQHDQLMACLRIINLNLEQDIWQWEFDNEETFTVRSVRNSLDIKRLPGAATATRWCNILPIKLLSYGSEGGVVGVRYSGVC
ncbi:RNA-directed DNA polymerase, eukaryota [Artemisia annua]|uniref:RNA-directed DNA polymerase, eukaryota n=1 Tax=Artemisia annua TaxID=35608 RepID=A0A2U1NPK3_ARTAN|nr:RNA-directed DNA polymerase, eukaryota [Artemisia annua]